MQLALIDYLKIKGRIIKIWYETFLKAYWRKATSMIKKVNR